MTDTNELTIQKSLNFSYYNEEFSQEETAQPQILARPDTNFLF